MNGKNKNIYHIKNAVTLQQDSVIDISSIAFAFVCFVFKKLENASTDNSYCMKILEENDHCVQHLDTFILRTCLIFISLLLISEIGKAEVQLVTQKLLCGVSLKKTSILSVEKRA
jgi:hypothetical protein